MTRQAFDRIVAAVMRTLPAEFDPFMGNLQVVIELEPSLELLREVGFTDEEIEAGDSLYGLFMPMDAPSPWAALPVDAQDWPHRIYIFQHPLEEDFPDPERLEIEIRKTVVHELAHHFGFSERDLERFDANPDPFRSPGEEAEEE